MPRNLKRAWARARVCDAVRNGFTSPRVNRVVPPAMRAAPAPKREVPISWFSAITTYFGYAILTVVGHIRDFLGGITGISRYKQMTPPGYAPMFNDWENFYTRRAYHRCHDCWNLPIGGPPTAQNMLVMQRTSTDGCRTMR